MPRARVPLTVVVLAAGQGTRMRSKTIKLLHPVAGQPMVGLTLDAVDTLRPTRAIVVVGFQAERVCQALDGRGCTFVLQKQQRGTGHAVLQAARKIGPRSTLLIVNGDLPMIRPATLSAFVTRHRKSGAALSVLTTELTDPKGYGRIVREGAGIARIVEHKDADRAERKIREINAGIYCAQPSKLLSVLRRLKPDNAQGEYYITDAVEELIRRGEKVQAICHPVADEVLGVNTRRELARASLALYAEKAEQLQDRGVTVLDPTRTWIDPRARIGRDTTLYPDVIIEGPTVVGRECVIRPGCRLVRCKVGNHVEIKDHSVLTDSRIGDGAEVGPSIR